jgi:glycosyltransferase involved in cell wall biosynthesis
MAVLPTLLCTANFPANTGFAWDFIERLYARMADRLAGHGVRTIVAYPAIAEPPRALSGSVAVPVALDTGLGTRRTRASLSDFIRRENVQVIFFSDRPAWNVWYRSLRSAGVRRIIVHDHTSDVRNVPRGPHAAVKRAIVNIPGVAADLIVAVSNFVAERDRAVSLLPSKKIRCVWNGLDPVDAGAEDSLPDIRTLLKLGPDTVLVGCACRATPEKGIDVLFKAFDRLARAAPPAPVLAYIGTGPEFNALSALRDTLRSADRIHMLGYLPGAASFLRTANVCVVPSIWQEAFSLAVLEMMVRGRAVIASNVGGVPEVIEDGVSGLLVPPNDTEALAGAITRVLASPPLQHALGSAARERAGRLFTADRQISQLLSTFQDVFST